MKEDKIYAAVLSYMCENYDYSLYANDFDALHVKSLRRAIASTPSGVSGDRMLKTKVALQDFFDAIFQKVVIYEDEAYINVVKYFDKGAQNEQEDRQIHKLRLELLEYKEEIEDCFKQSALYTFADTQRKELEQILLGFSKNEAKEILRQQMRLVYDMSEKDVIVFLNDKVFLKQFLHVRQSLAIENNYIYLLQDEYFLHNLWEEIQKHIKHTLQERFCFFQHEPLYFYTNYEKVLSVEIEKILLKIFLNMDEELIQEYTKEFCLRFDEKMLLECSEYLLQSVLHNNLKAISFLKFYCQSTYFHNNKRKLRRAPLMDVKGHIYNYQEILWVLKQKESLAKKIEQKKEEIKKIEDKVRNALSLFRQSHEQMQTIEKKHIELLEAIARVDEQINDLKAKQQSKHIEINRLELSKRDLLEVFSQIQVRLKTQKNVLKNRSTELEKWDEKKHEKLLIEEDIQKEYMLTCKEYEKICLLLSEALGKEPFVL